jgi:hypothetical protein
MVARRKSGEFWTETKRVVEVEGVPIVKVTSCCCAAPGSTAKGCSIVAGNKTRCRCFCHSKRVQKSDLRANGVQS